VGNEWVTTESSPGSAELTTAPSPRVGWNSPMADAPGARRRRATPFAWQEFRDRPCCRACSGPAGCRREPSAPSVFLRMRIALQFDYVSTRVGEKRHHLLPW
jgi:hypothetical protein